MMASQPHPSHQQLSATIRHQTNWSKTHSTLAPSSLWVVCFITTNIWQSELILNTLFWTWGTFSYNHSYQSFTKNNHKNPAQGKHWLFWWVRIKAPMRCTDIVLFNFKTFKYTILHWVFSWGDPVFAFCLPSSLVAFSLPRAVIASSTSRGLPAKAAPLCLVG